MKIILIAGKAGSGKSYLGERIVALAKEKSIRAIQTEYSKYIKMYAKEILGYDGSRENKPRKFLQDTGSYIREVLGDNKFFVRRMLEDFRVYEEYFDIVIVSDVRLIQEIEDIKSSKYDCISIQVNNYFKEYNLTEEEKAHITENELDSYGAFDFIVNDETKEGIEKFAKEIVEKMKER